MAQKNWSLDTAHSTITFRVKHMMVSNVRGEFGKFDVVLNTEENDFTKAHAKLTIPVDTITTNNNQRDGHLKSDDFFDAAHHPNITFESKAITRKSDAEYDMTGDLTIRETTKPVTFNVENIGLLENSDGSTRAGFEITGKINRKEFGLKYNALTEAGGMVVGDEIRINANVELLHQKKA